MFQFLISLWQEISARPDFWGFVSIPLVAAVVTWAHVWLAMQMTLYPVEFVGWKKPWFGWQGIIPRKAAKMSNIIVDKTIMKLGTLSEVFHEMEPDKIAAHMSHALSVRVEEFADEIMSERHAILWTNLPQAIKKRVYSRIKKQIPAILDGLVKDMSANIDQLVDLKEMIVERLETDKVLMVKIFKEVGDNEFKFIVRSSFWIGLFFGVVQMTLWYFFPSHYMLPLYGAALGCATNWVALNMVFRPLHPIKIGPFVIQGVFLKRQAEVSRSFSTLVTQELISIKQIMQQIFSGTRSRHTRYLVKKHLSPLMDAGSVKVALQLTVGAKGFVDFKQTVADRAVDLSMEPMSDPSFNQERAVVIQKIFEERMKNLTSGEFQDLLRPAFQEDEWILITMGAVMGFAAGWIQLLTGFS